MTEKKIRVLVVDDSVFYRVAIPRLLNAFPDIEVVGVARDGNEALEKVRQLRPDVVTLDIIMPVMDGLTTLKKLMIEQPTPVLMLSALTQRGAQETIESLAWGAVDFVPKPGDESGSAAIKAIRDELVAKVRAAAAVTPRRARLPERKPMAAESLGETFARKNHLVVMSASTGGPAALLSILPALPRDFPAQVVIQQHIPPTFVPALVEQLAAVSTLPLAVAEPDTRLEPGKVFLTPATRFCEFSLSRGGLVLSERGGQTPSASAADALLRSAAEIAGELTCGVLLTGMGADGAHGLLEVKNSGGLTIAQDEETSLIWGAPGRAVEMGAASLVLPLERIAATISNFVLGLDDYRWARAV